MPEPVLVADVLQAVLDEMRGMVRNGRVTERGLARRAGLSQAHVHNVLKGARALSPPVADRLLGATGLCALEVAARHVQRAEASR